MTLRPLWFIENRIDTEYQTYRIMAFEKAALSSFLDLKLMPYYENTYTLNKVAECFLTVDTVYAYMMQDKTDYSLFMQLEDMCTNNEQFDELKLYVNSLQPTLAEIYRIGDTLKRYCESRMIFTKESGITKRIFVEHNNKFYKYKLNGERLIADGYSDNYPKLPGDLLVQTKMEFPLEETIIPIIEINIWRFI